MLLTLITCLSILSAGVVVHADNNFFYTRPQLQAPVLNVLIDDDPTPGYVFLAPWENGQAAPLIYDKKGDLVFDGFGILGASNAHNFHVCDYAGTDHLCFSQMNNHRGYGWGQGVIVDTDYRVVKTVNTGGKAGPSDMHEFQLVERGKSALLTTYKTSPYDLSSFNITSGLGWLLHGGFQEVDVESGEVIFEWYVLDHIDLDQTQTLPGKSRVHGDGFTALTAFDYFHLNSVDKSKLTGNYLISGRHTSTLYMIDSITGDIVWRLSSEGPSDYECVGFNFSSQHNARIVFESSIETVLSIFDNASDGLNTTMSQSSGLMITLNHKTMSASRRKQLSAPRHHGLFSTSQGSYQILEDGGSLIGWGSVPAVTEYGPSGRPTWHAWFGRAMNYRAFTANWESTPSFSIPDVYAYASDTYSEPRLYVSWNGATTVAWWNFYGAQSLGDDLVYVGTTHKNGFETKFIAPKFFSWWQVEAVAADGTILRTSDLQSTLVPSQALSAVCNEEGCIEAYPDLPPEPPARQHACVQQTRPRPKSKSKGVHGHTEQSPDVYTKDQVHEIVRMVAGTLLSVFQQQSGTSQDASTLADGFNGQLNHESPMQRLDDMRYFNPLWLIVGAMVLVGLFHCVVMIGVSGGRGKLVTDGFRRFTKIF